MPCAVGWFSIELDAVLTPTTNFYIYMMSPGGTTFQNISLISTTQPMAANGPDYAPDMTLGNGFQVFYNQTSVTTFVGE